MTTLRSLPWALALIAAAVPAVAADLGHIILPPPPSLSEAVTKFVRVPAGHIALTHVRVVDGTGVAETTDRTVLLDGPRIAALLDATAPVPPGYNIVDLTGSTVLPGIVGMHDHLYHIAYPNIGPGGRGEEPSIVPQMTFSAPRLYLANGVTTMRTAGSVQPYTDLNLKAAIDRGELVGPHLDITAPYLEGAHGPFIDMHPLKDAEDARRTVAFWADQGATSFKAYMNITRAELKAAIDEAHRRGLKLTGHLCAVSYPEAIDLGIDDLEHGFWVNTQNDPGKKPDVCPESAGDPTIEHMDPEGADATALIRKLIAHHVAITSTLPAFEYEFPARSTLFAKSLEAMTPQARESYLYVRARMLSAPADKQAADAARFKHELALEKRFVEEGGLLIAGPDPTSTGGIVAGYGDLRGIELLVDAGFKPEAAIRIATLNGATYLGLQDRIGSIAAGKNADLMIVRGDPAKNITDIENVDMVFKDGVGFDSAKLTESVRARYGQY